MNKNKECKNKNCITKFVLAKLNPHGKYCSEKCYKKFWYNKNKKRISDKAIKYRTENKYWKNKDRINTSYYIKKNLKEIIHLYEIEMKSMLEISKLFKISRETVRYYLFKNNIDIRTQSETTKNYFDKNPQYSEIEVKEFKELFSKLQQQGNSMWDISKKLEMNRTTISRILGKDKLTLGEIRKLKKEKNPLYLYQFGLEEHKDEIIKLYKEGNSTVSIGRLYGCSQQVVSRRLTSWGVELREGRYNIKKEKIKCDDGHYCRSSFEREVCNYLFHHGILHQYEVRICSDKTFKCDFKVGDYFIEVWGLIGVDEYEDRMLRKLEIYKKNKLKLISIFPKDDISKKLGFLIPLFSKVQKEIISFEEK